MRAVMLRQFGTPVAVEDMPAPVIGTGEAIVNVVAAAVQSYAGEVLSGQRQHMLSLPIVPGGGAIGRVRSLGPDATRLSIGDWVYCDPTVRSRDEPVNPDITLQGISARGAGGMKLQAYFHDGAWAEHMRVPTENAVPIGPIDAADADKWLALGSFLVPYGGLSAANIKAGETVLVSGATGNFGSAAVAVALAMGAGCVIATGRNPFSLADLARRFGPRVRAVSMTGEELTDTAAMLNAAPGPIDCVFDILPPHALATQARAAIHTVRPYGRVVLMGGINMLGGAGLELAYNWIMRNCVTIHGAWMYPQTAPHEVVRMIRAGLLSLDHFQITPFALCDVADAVAHAAVHAGPFDRTVLSPQLV